MCPPLDIKDILRKSLINQKLVVTLPWIVQYISMLDAITLRLNYYRELFSILYELYIMCASLPQLTIRPTSIFILRTCLGWLFDQPNVPNDYYQYRQNRKPLDELHERNNLVAVQILVPKDIQEYFISPHKVILTPSYKQGADGKMSCLLQQQQQPQPQRNENNVMNWPSIITNQQNECHAFDPLLENILIAACPFLADFRVSIMPRKNSKTVSRTGRYRHVTTRIYESPANKNPVMKIEEDIQARLTDAFLQSQSLSVRKTVDFIIERTVSAVIKDFQIEHFIPIKKNTLAQIDTLSINSKELIEDNLYAVYSKGEKQLSDKWHGLVPAMIGNRVKVRQCAIKFFLFFEIEQNNLLTFCWHGFIFIS